MNSWSWTQHVFLCCIGLLAAFCKCTDAVSSSSSVIATNTATTTTTSSSSATTIWPYESEPCGEHTECFHVEISPQLEQDTNYEVILQHNDDSATTTFNVQFVISNDVACLDAAIAFDFELIDYDDVAEYIQIFDMNQNGSMLQQCGGGLHRACNVFTPCDLHHANIDLVPHEPYTLSVVESKHVDALCAEYHNFTINARLSLSCFAIAPSETSDAPLLPSAETTDFHEDTSTSQVFVFACHYVDHGEHDPITYNNYGLLMSEMVLQSLEIERAVYNVSVPTVCSCAVCAVFNTFIASAQNETDCKLDANLLSILQHEHEQDEYDEYDSDGHAYTDAIAVEHVEEEDEEEEYVAIFTISVVVNEQDSHGFTSWLLSMVQSDEFRLELTQKMNERLLAVLDLLHSESAVNATFVHQFEIEWIEILSNGSSLNSTDTQHETLSSQDHHRKSPLLFLCIGAAVLLLMCIVTIIAKPAEKKSTADEEDKENKHGDDDGVHVRGRHLSTQQLMQAQLENHEYQQQSIQQEAENEPSFVMTTVNAVPFKLYSNYDTKLTQYDDDDDEEEEEEEDDDENSNASDHEKGDGDVSQTHSFDGNAGDDEKNKTRMQAALQQMLEAIGESVENHDNIKLCLYAEDSRQVIVSPDGVIIDELVSKPRSSYTTVSGEFFT